MGCVDNSIETPLDVNKQSLIWNDSAVIEDGSILVRIREIEEAQKAEKMQTERRGRKLG
ncbi:MULTISPECIES: phage tail fiber protein [Proteus]|uniref:Phage tail protein C-terminal domain-containing protein n=1 Tax=Proteus mirabilis TaxID=584 RepID=A0ABD5LQN9_PROMI